MKQNGKLRLLRSYPRFSRGARPTVHSVTTLCTPHNGSTLRYIADEFKLTDLVKAVSYAYAGVMGRSLLNGFVDFHLEQFGLTGDPRGIGAGASHPGAQARI